MVDRSDDASCLLGLEGLAVERVVLTVLGVKMVQLVTDDPDGLHDRALKAGATIIRALADTDYGSREFAARDPEGNLWSFGTYRGEPVPAA